MKQNHLAYIAAIKRYFTLLVTLFKFSKSVVSGIASVIVAIALIGWLLPHKKEKKDQRIHPPQEKAEVVIDNDRFRPPNKKKITLDHLVLSYAEDSLLTASLTGEWDELNARIEQGNHEDESQYRVWMRCEWKSAKPFPREDKRLYFLADGKPMGLNIIIFAPFGPLEPGDPYTVKMMLEIPLNYLERVAVAQHVEMKIGGFELVIDQPTHEKIREFVHKALEIRKEQMAKLKPIPPIPCK